MDSILATRERLLAVLNEELGSEFTDLVPAFRAWRENADRDSIGVCGFPCDGGCGTCVESDAALTAFFAPEAPPVTPVEPLVSEASASVEGSGPSTTEATESAPSAPSRVGTLAVSTEEEDRVLENARALDAVEEMIRSGEAAEVQIMANAGDEDDEDYDPYDAYGCHCLECLNYESQDDGGYGLDWNESGYFD
jgi:hypothetical protein